MLIQYKWWPLLAEKAYVKHIEIVMQKWWLFYESGHYSEVLVSSDLDVFVELSRQEITY